MENRYEKYKDSEIAWIGEIPEHWEMLKIKNAFYIVSGATPKTDNSAYWDGEIIWITPADYKTEDRVIKSGKRNITLAGLNSCGTSIVPQGSIIFSKRAPIGLVAINVVPLCTNQGCISCIPRSFVNNKYFYYLISVLTEWFELLGAGTTFKELSTNNFVNFNLSQPPFFEQQSIADYLDKKCDEIDELIALQEEMITKLQSYKQSVITEVVTKGLDKNVPLKDSGIEWIGKIPEHWTVTKIKNTFNIVSGATPKTDNSAYWDGEITWITPADYKTEDKIIKSGKRNITLAGLNSCGTSIIPQGSIIFSKRAPIGLVAINTVSLCTNQGCLSCIPRNSVNSLYFYYLMSVLTEWFELLGSGTTFKELSTNNFANVSLSCPPISEQQTIADYLDQKCSEIDELISIKQQKIEKLKDYKKSLIFECVTGKRKV